MGRWPPEAAGRTREQRVWGRDCVTDGNTAVSAALSQHPYVRAAAGASVRWASAWHRGRGPAALSGRGKMPHERPLVAARAAPIQARALSPGQCPPSVLTARTETFHLCDSATCETTPQCHGSGKLLRAYRVVCASRRRCSRCLVPEPCGQTGNPARPPGRRAPTHPQARGRGEAVSLDTWAQLGPQGVPAWVWTVGPSRPAGGVSISLFTRLGLKNSLSSSWLFAQWTSGYFSDLLGTGIQVEVRF